MGTTSSTPEADQEFNFAPYVPPPQEGEDAAPDATVAGSAPLGQQAEVSTQPRPPAKRKQQEEEEWFCSDDDEDEGTGDYIIADMPLEMPMPETGRERRRRVTPLAPLPFQPSDAAAAPAPAADLAAAAEPAPKSERVFAAIPPPESRWRVDSATGTAIPPLPRREVALREARAAESFYSDRVRGLERMAAEASSLERARCIVLRSQVGRVIGKKGAKIKAVTVSTGARIDVWAPGKKDERGRCSREVRIGVGFEMPDETVEVTITGTKEQVEKAKEEMGKSGLLKETDALRRMTCAQSSLGRIIGKKGSMLAQIETSTGCRVFIDDVTPEDGGAKPKPDDQVDVWLAGDADKLAHGVRYVLLIARGAAIDCEAEAAAAAAAAAAKAAAKATAAAAEGTKKPAAAAAAAAAKAPAAAAGRAPSAAEAVALVGPQAVGSKSKLFAKAGFSFDGAAAAASTSGTAAAPGGSEPGAAALPAAKKPVRFWGAVAARRAAAAAGGEAEAAAAAPSGAQAQGEAAPSGSAPAGGEGTAADPAAVLAAAEAPSADAPATVTASPERQPAVVGGAGQSAFQTTSSILFAAPTPWQSPSTPKPAASTPAAAAPSSVFTPPLASVSPLDVAGVQAPAWMSASSLEAIAEHKRRASLGADPQQRAVAPATGAVVGTAAAGASVALPLVWGPAATSATTVQVPVVAEQPPPQNEQKGAMKEEETEYKSILEELWREEPAAATLLSDR